MDPEVRELERRLSANPRDIEAGRRLAALDRRRGWTYFGQSPEEWGAQVTKGPQVEDVRRALDVLRRLGPRACDQWEVLAPLIERNSGGHRIGALEAAGALAEPRLLPSLLKALRSEIKEVRELAAKAVGAIGDPSVIPELEARIKRGGRAAPSAVLALAHLGGEAGRRAMEAALVHRSPEIQEAGVKAASVLGARDQRAQVRRIAEEGLAWVQVEAIIVLARLTGAEMLPELLALLEHTDLTLRYAAVVSLGELGSKEAVPALLDLLSGSVNFRSEAMRALGSIGDPRAIEPIKELLRGGSDEERAEAARVLGVLDAAGCVAELKGALKDGSAPVRLAAVRAIATESAAGALAEALGDRHRDVREAAAEGLVRLGAFSDLIRGLEDSGYQAGAAAARALMGLGLGRAEAPLRRLLAASEVQTRFIAARALGELGARGAEDELRALSKSDRVVTVRAAAVAALSRLLGAEGGELFLAASQEASGLVRIQAMRALARHQVPGARRVLEQALGDGMVALEAARALGALGDPAAIPALLRAAESPHLRSEICGALGRFADPRTLPLLDDILDDGLFRNRLAAVRALKNFSGAEATPLLVKATRREKGLDVNAEALRQLGERGDTRAIDALLDLLVDSLENRRDAAEALGRIGKRCGLSALVKAFPKRPDRPFAVRQFVALAALESHDVEARLIRALEASEKRARSVAAGALARIGTARAIPFLEAALERESFADPRLGMARAIKRIKRREGL